MKNIVIIGLGNQGKAWALNLRDSGWEVKVGLRPNSPSVPLARKLGFEIIDYTQSNTNNNFVILTPDHTHFEVVSTIVKYNDKANFIYAHGFALTYTDIVKKYHKANHILLAPKAIASELRFHYETKDKLGGVYSFEYCHNQAMEKWTQDLAQQLGLTSIHPCTVEDETKADLFSEQSLLCSVLPYAALYSFKQLTEAGISKEVAYFECWYEVKLIADTLIKIGPREFFNLISPNALVGSEIGRSILFNADYLKNLNEIFQNINSGKFEKELKNIDIDSVRKEVLDFWDNQELTHFHQQIQEELF